MMKVLLGSLWLCLVPAIVQAQNFTAGNQAAAAYLEHAEQCRRDIAVFWLGKPLPKWGGPCHVTVKVWGADVNSSGGGATTFNVDGGEVWGWRMNVMGPDKRLRDSVIPHEVDHAVRHSITRRPMPRWLDEGAASLFESKESHARMRRDARRYATHQYSAWRQFDSMKYPPEGRNGENITAVYSTGFSVVEWLLTTWGKDRLLQFMTDRRPPSQKFTSHYGMGVAEGQRQWLAWVAARPVECEECGCYINGKAVTVRQQAVQGRPTLWVVTAGWCFACKPYIWDFNTDARFRGWLYERFNVVPVNHTRYEQWCVDKGVRSLPAFVTSLEPTVIHGYYGKGWLTGQLAGILAKHAQPAQEPNAGWGPVTPPGEPDSPFTQVPDASPGWPQDRPGPNDPIVTNPPTKDTQAQGGTSAPRRDQSDSPTGQPVPNDNGQQQPAPGASATADAEAGQRDGGGLFGGWLLPLAVAAATAAGVGIPAWAVWTWRAGKLVHGIRKRREGTNGPPPFDPERPLQHADRPVSPPPPPPAPQYVAGPQAPAQGAGPAVTTHTVTAAPRVRRETLYETQFIDVPTHDYQRAREQAVASLGRRYPQWIEVMETESSLIRQYLAGNETAGHAGD